MSGGQHVINRKIYLTVGGAEGRTLRPEGGTIYYAQFQHVTDQDIVMT